MRTLTSRHLVRCTTTVIAGVVCTTAAAKLIALFVPHASGLLSASDNADWQSVVSALGAMGAGAGASGGGDGSNAGRDDNTGGRPRGWFPVYSPQTWWQYLSGQDRERSWFPNDVAGTYRPNEADPYETMVKFSQWLQSAAEVIAGPASGTGPPTSGTSRS